MYQSRLVKPHIQVWPWRKLRLGPSSPGIYLVGMRHDVHRESDNTMRHIYHCLKTWIVEYEFQKEEVGGGAVSEIYNFREKWTASKSKMLIGPFRKSGQWRAFLADVGRDKGRFGSLRWPVLPKQSFPEQVGDTASPEGRAHIVDSFPCQAEEL